MLQLSWLTASADRPASRNGGCAEEQAQHGPTANPMPATPAEAVQAGPGPLLSYQAFGSWSAGQGWRGSLGPAQKAATRQNGRLRWQEPWSQHVTLGPSAQPSPDPAAFEELPRPLSKQGRLPAAAADSGAGTAWPRGRPAAFRSERRRGTEPGKRREDGNRAVLDALHVCYAKRCQRHTLPCSALPSGCV